MRKQFHEGFYIQVSLKYIGGYIREAVRWGELFYWPTQMLSEPFGWWKLVVC